VNPIKPEEVVLGQYDGYKDDPTVPDDSNTPTFASVVLRVHNERWEGISFLHMTVSVHITVEMDILEILALCVFFSFSVPFLNHNIFTFCFNPLIFMPCRCSFHS